MVTLVQESRAPFQERSHVLLDATGKGYTCEMSIDGVLLDGLLMSIVLATPGHITFVSDAETILCTPASLWYAFAGSGVSPTAADCGQLLAENLARWSAAQHSLTTLHALEHQAKMVVEHMQALPSSPYVPTPRLDAFTEEALSRCDIHPTHAQVQALAHVLDQTVETIITWLKDRGKIVVGVETTFSPDGTASARQVGDVVVRRKSPLHVAGTQEIEAARPPASSSIGAAKRTMFRWTPALVELLTAAFLSKPDGNVRATAQAIATQHDWPMKAVEYKIYDLQLPGKKQQQESAAPVSVSRAEPLSDHEKASPLPVAQVPFVVQPGAFQWDMKIDGHFQRWGLDYPYGSFPLAQPGTRFVYRDHVYMLEQVSSAHLTVAKLNPVSQERKNDE